jgi:hypothetical protein
MTKSTKSKSTSRNRVVRDIALKSIHRDIMRDNKNATLTTKQMRVVLRREFASSMSHAKNNAWSFSSREYDIVRSRFDAKYRAKIERAAKSSTRKNATPIETPATIDA